MHPTRDIIIIDEVKIAKKAYTGRQTHNPHNPAQESLVSGIPGIPVHDRIRVTLSAVDPLANKNMSLVNKGELYPSKNCPGGSKSLTNLQSVHHTPVTRARSTNISLPAW
eukprot:CAMPEP_0118700002 /NCGR_PEP_ID=MMETSP0800-20121206/16280_1 /TAXON_ID=210618 ORGANISM="Striatella unipunctata, Strain CCMP2910" /NCGR_SAMPLE_ID=MMETSP0800 /ASSEMBLY_ACC=CAM_ASM_000638 /LENGTH=109 /DNA_ID=CAMNT_0006600417 /DNA_START=366 /DNA_END=692 /DNA_ORIENTATION=+